MKFHKQVAIALVAVSASVFGFGSIASAGEGAAAGAVAATLDENGLVVEMTAAGAIGKNDAAALATSNFGVISATALGSAGVIEIISDTGNYTFSEGGQSESEFYKVQGSLNRSYERFALPSALNYTCIIFEVLS